MGREKKAEPWLGCLNETVPWFRSPRVSYSSGSVIHWTGDRKHRWWFRSSIFESGAATVERRGEGGRAGERRSYFGTKGDRILNSLVAREFFGIGGGGGEGRGSRQDAIFASGKEGFRVTYRHGRSRRIHRNGWRIGRRSNSRSRSCPPCYRIVCPPRTLCTCCTGNRPRANAYPCTTNPANETFGFFPRGLIASRSLIESPVRFFRNECDGGGGGGRKKNLSITRLRSLGKRNYRPSFLRSCNFDADKVRIRNCKHSIRHAFVRIGNVFPFKD